MAKFKVGDVVSLKDGYSVPSGASGNRAVVVEVLRPAGGDFNYWLRFDGGREREQHGDHLVLANAARNAKFKVGDAVTWYEDLVPHKGAIVRRVLGGDVEIMWRGKTLVVEDNDLVANAARSRNAYGTNYIDEGDRVWVVSEKKKGTIKSFTTTKGPQPIITVKYDDGSVGVADAKDIRVIPNSIRSRNAVVQKALNACAKNADFKVGDVVGLKIMDGGRRDYVIYEVLPDSYRLCYADNFGAGCERVKKWPSDEFVDKHRRIKVPLNADTSVLREAAVNSARTTNAVVAKALNASHKHLS